jgi:hypothetical protein
MKTPDRKLDKIEPRIAQEAFLNILVNCWQNEMKAFFESGKMCSERSLQAELYSLLKLHPEFDVWVEPKLKLKDGYLHSKVPDILVTKGDTVVAIIELKYNLAKGIDCTGDIEKLLHFVDLTEPILLKTDRETGNWDNAGFRINDETIFILAVVAWAGTEALTKEVWKWHEKIIDNRFVHLIGKIDYSGRSIFTMLNYQEIL